MQIDGRTVPNGRVISADLCIVGAGAAGITLALKFAGRSASVVVLESGGLAPDEETQSLVDGRSTGLPYFPLRASRLRCFGGTTAHWGGFCRPFYPIDFEARGWVPHSGWPIGRADLDPFYPEAHEICQIGPVTFEPSAWHIEDAPVLPLSGHDVRTRLIQFSPPTRFGVRYRDPIFRSGNVAAYLHSTVTRIVLRENGSEVKRLEVATLAGNRFTVAARLYVIACGGIDNARLLLASNDVTRNGIGNGHDQVGRFFADHINLDTAAVFPLRSDVAFTLYQRDRRGELRSPRQQNGRATPIMGYLGLDEKVQREARTLNYSGEVGETFWSDYFLHDGRFNVPDEMFRDESRTWLTDFAEITKTLWRNLGDATDRLFNRPDDDNRTFYKIRTTQEQAPNPDSRVRLAAAKDRLGMPLADLQWRLTELDRHTIRVAMDRLTGALGASGIGRLRVGIDLDAPEWPTHMQGSWHHSGTTRMHADPKRGVVDAHCQVHGVHNLYLAGSSVFPTNGDGNPTLTIVALSLRLARRLDTMMKT